MEQALVQSPIDITDLAAIDRALEDESLGLALAGAGLMAAGTQGLEEAGLAWATGESLRGYALTRCGLSVSILREKHPESLLRAARHLCTLLAKEGRAS